MKRTSLAVLFLAGVAAALDVNPNDILAQVSASLDAKYTPFETAGQTIATWVSDTPGPVVTPDKDAAGMTPGVSKGDLANALWASFSDVHTNGMWVAYNDSGILGYWNVNGIADPQPRHLYRPGGEDAYSGCPEITTTPTCVPSAWTSAPPASCDAIPAACQTFYEVDSRGNIGAITRQRSYDPTTRFWYTANTEHPLGQPYWLEKYGAVGYQSSDATQALLIGWYCLPVVRDGGVKAIVLVQLGYEAISMVLAPYNMRDTVIYLLEATSGELVASSNAEPIFDDTGTQVMAKDAGTELISASATYIEQFSTRALGEYRNVRGITITVADYQRAHGTLHFKIVMATYADVPTSTSTGLSDGLAVAAIVCSMLAVCFISFLTIFYFKKPVSKPMTSDDGQEHRQIEVKNA